MAFEREQEIKAARLAFRSVLQADGDAPQVRAALDLLSAEATALNIILMKTSGGASKSQSPSDVSKSHHIQHMVGCDSNETLLFLLND